MAKACGVYLELTRDTQTRTLPKLLEGIADLHGFTSFTGDLVLSSNDLDDEFLDGLCEILVRTNSFLKQLVSGKCHPWVDARFPLT